MNTDGNTLSAEYTYLEQRLNDIKGHFELEQFKHVSWDALSGAQMDFVRAYIALCHAEIESYLEQRSANIVDTAFNLWNSSKNISMPLLALFVHFKFIEDKQNNINNTNEKICTIVNNFKHEIIYKNNGLKGDSIKKMFKPLGIDIDSLDSAWISTLDSYGSKRGETVHKSAKIQQPIDISTEISNIEIIKAGIVDFETVLNSLVDN